MSADAANGRPLTATDLLQDSGSEFYTDDESSYYDSQDGSDWTSSQGSVPAGTAPAPAPAVAAAPAPPAPVAAPPAPAGPASDDGSDYTDDDDMTGSYTGSEEEGSDWTEGSESEGSLPPPPAAAPAAAAAPAVAPVAPQPAAATAALDDDESDYTDSEYYTEEEDEGSYTGSESEEMAEAAPAAAAPVPTPAEPAVAPTTAVVAEAEEEEEAEASFATLPSVEQSWGEHHAPQPQAAAITAQDATDARVAALLASLGTLSLQPAVPAPAPPQPLPVPTSSNPRVAALLAATMGLRLGSADGHATHDDGELSFISQASGGVALEEGEGEEDTELRTHSSSHPSSHASRCGGDASAGVGVWSLGDPAPGSYATASPSPFAGPVGPLPPQAWSALVRTGITDAPTASALLGGLRGPTAGHQLLHSSSSAAWWRGLPPVDASDPLHASRVTCHALAFTPSSASAPTPAAVSVTLRLWCFPEAVSPPLALRAPPAMPGLSPPASSFDLCPPATTTVSPSAPVPPTFAWDWDPVVALSSVSGVPPDADAVEAARSAWTRHLAIGVATIEAVDAGSGLLLGTAAVPLAPLLRHQRVTTGPVVMSVPLQLALGHCGVGASVDSPIAGDWTEGGSSSGTLTLVWRHDGVEGSGSGVSAPPLPPFATTAAAATAMPLAATNRQTLVAPPPPVALGSSKRRVTVKAAAVADAAPELLGATAAATGRRTVVVAAPAVALPAGATVSGAAAAAAAAAAASAAPSSSRTLAPADAALLRALFGVNKTGVPSVGSAGGEWWSYPSLCEWLAAGRGLPPPARLPAPLRAAVYYPSSSSSFSGEGEEGGEENATDAALAAVRDAFLREAERRAMAAAAASGGAAATALLPPPSPASAATAEAVLACFRHAEGYASRKLALLRAKTGALGATHGAGATVRVASALEADPANGQEDAWTQGEAAALAAAAETGALSAGEMTLARFRHVLGRYFGLPLPGSTAGSTRGSLSEDGLWGALRTLFPEAGLAATPPADPAAPGGYLTLVPYREGVARLLAGAAGAAGSIGGAAAAPQVRPEVALLRGKLLAALAEHALPGTSGVGALADAARAADASRVGLLPWSVLGRLLQETTGLRLPNAPLTSVSTAAATSAPAPAATAFGGAFLADTEAAADEGLRLASLYREGAKADVARSALLAAVSATYSLTAFAGTGAPLAHTFTNPYPTPENFRVTVAALGETEGAASASLMVVADPSAWAAVTAAAGARGAAVAAGAGDQGKAPTALPSFPWDARPAVQSLSAISHPPEEPLALRQLGETEWEVRLGPRQSVTLPLALLALLPPQPPAAVGASALTTPPPVPLPAFSVAVTSARHGTTAALLRVVAAAVPPPVSRVLHYAAGWGSVLQGSVPLPPSSQKGQVRCVVRSPPSDRLALVTAGPSVSFRVRLPHASSASASSVVTPLRHALYLYAGEAEGAALVPAAVVEVRVTPVTALALPPGLVGQALRAEALLPLPCAGRTGGGATSGTVWSSHSGIVAPAPLSGGAASSLQAPAPVSLPLVPGSSNRLPCVVAPKAPGLTRALLAVTPSNAAASTTVSPLALVLVTLQASLPPITKTYDVAVPPTASGTLHKRLPFFNAWGAPRTFLVSSSDPAVAEAVEPSLAVPARESAYLRLALAPPQQGTGRHISTASSPREALIFVTDAESGAVEEVLKLAVRSC